MERVSKYSDGLLSKISSLFNSSLFSDVEFIFIDDIKGNTKIYGHKLILALGGKGFADMFFKKEASSSTVKLPASEKASFELLFRFLYTHDVQFRTLEEAQELYVLAERYVVEELSRKCHKYMLEDQLTIENISSKYQFALKVNGLLLKCCRDFICLNSQLILESNVFTTMQPEVIEDIVKQDNLSVASELEIIKAVLKWGKEDLQRKQMPSDEKYLRAHINQFMKYLRFLTLSLEEFEDFVDHHDVLSAKESSLITRKIYQPVCNVNFPDDICSINVKRKVVQVTENSSSLDNFSINSNCTRTDILKPKTSNYSKQPLLLLQSYSNFTVSDSAQSPALIYSKPAGSDSANSMLSDLTKSMISDLSKSIITDSSKSMTSDYSKYSALDFSNSTSSNHLKPTASYSQDVVPNKISYEVKSLSPLKEQNVSSALRRTNFHAASNISSFVQSFPPSLKEYSFSLMEIQPFKHLGLSFPKDIECSVSFRMKKGTIYLHGFELKIQNKNDETDELDVYVRMTGFSRPLSKSYKNKLCNNNFRVMFTEPMVLQEGSRGELEVSIEDLLLNRCSVCSDKPYELNRGLDFALEFRVKSNRKNDDGSLFLIDKLFF